MVLLHAAEPALGAQLQGARAQCQAKPVRWLGRRGEGLPWQEVDGERRERRTVD